MFKKKDKKPRESKPKTLLRQLFEAWIELLRFQKAKKQMAKMVWSTDYLVYLLQLAGADSGLKVVFRNGFGQEVEISRKSKTVQDYYAQENEYNDLQNSMRAKFLLDKMYGLGA